MNPEQRAAVEAPAGPLCILAGAGTGKTFTLVRRIARLVELGASERRILVVTFSADAKKEIGGRLEREGLRDVDVSTWHSLAWRMLREDETPWARWELDKGPAFRRLVGEAIGSKGVGWGEEADEAALRRLMGLAAANLWTPDDPAAVGMAVKLFAGAAKIALDAWRLVDELCARDRVLTFDALLVHAVTHLRDEGARLWWGARWDHLLQDEYQDVSPVQKALAVALAEGHRSYVVVGDPDQSIYAFRGSSPAHIVAFPAEWGAETITLTRNYRSGRAIIAAGNAVIAPTSTRAPLLAERDLDGRVEVVEAEDVDDEARVLAEHIEREHESGAAWKDFAVLWRTNAQSRAVEEHLLRKGVPHVILGADPFFARREVRSLVGYLRLAAGSEAQEDVEATINTPNRFLGKAFVALMVMHREDTTTWGDAVAIAAAQEHVWAKQKRSAEDWARIVEDLRRGVAAAQQPASLLAHVARVTGVGDWLKKRAGGEDEDAGSVIDEAIAAASRHQTVEAFLKFVDKAIAGGRRTEPGQVTGDRVVCCSIHKSKGLEWPRVWVVGTNDGKLPHSKAVEEEERRLMYVATTRARDELTFSWWASSGGDQRDGRPSRFLGDAGLMRPEHFTGRRAA